MSFRASFTNLILRFSNYFLRLLMLVGLEVPLNSIAATASTLEPSIAIQLTAQDTEIHSCIRSILDEASKIPGLRNRNVSEFHVYALPNGAIVRVDLLRGAGNEAAVRQSEELARRLLLDCRYRPSNDPPGIPVTRKIRVPLAWQAIHRELPAACRPREEDYPPVAIRTGAMGSTRVRYSLDSRGAVASSQIARVSGKSREHRLLDRIALSMVANCRFAIGQYYEPDRFYVADFVWSITGSDFFDAYTNHSQLVNFSASSGLRARSTALFGIGEFRLSSNGASSLACVRNITRTEVMNIEDYVSESIANEFAAHRLLAGDANGIPLSGSVELRETDPGVVQLAIRVAVGQRPSSEITIEAENLITFPPIYRCRDAHQKFHRALAELIAKLLTHADLLRFADSRPHQ
jgi:TonB family protein